MKNIRNYSFLLLALTSILFTACEKDDPSPAEDLGTFDLIFDNEVGGQPVSLATEDATDFPFTNGMDQSFNITRLGYYVSKVELSGPDGAYFADEVSTGADAAQVKGFYHVLESDANSQIINLENVPAGKYNQVTFTLGIDAETVQEGATGGVLDPAEGAWLWNWDAGYIGFVMEGRSPASPKEADQFNPDNSVKLHIGGWKDIAENPNMVNNVKRITLNFPSSVEVESRLSPSAHLIMDLMKVLEGNTTTVDFSTTFAVHAPAKGKEVADNLEQAFTVDHVHQ